MQNVPDPVLPGKVSGAGASGDVLAEAVAAAILAEADGVDALEPADPGRAGPGRWGSWAPTAALGWRRRAEVREAVKALGMRRDDAVAVSVVETLPAVGVGEELLDRRLDVLALPDLRVLNES